MVIGGSGHTVLLWCLRRVLPLVLLLVSAVPSFAEKKLIAAVMTTDIPRYREAHRAFVRALAQKGYDQNNTEIILQAPNPDPISWANTVRKFEALAADVIVAYGAPITLAAMRETHDLPIVFVDVYGPVETGISRSMTMTGTNLCGVSSKVPMVTLIKTIQEFKRIRNMGVIYSSREAGSLVQLHELKRIGAQQGFAVIDANPSSAAGLDTMLNSVLPHVDCLYVSECSIGSRQFEKIVAKANSYRVPVVSQMPESAGKGALVTLEVSPVEQGQLAGESVARVLGGAKPGQIPIVTPKKIELIINMRAAKALDLHVPFQGLSAATKILK
jgi:putative ABC transport system substrate-binding protein